METARISDKGQITLPARTRRILGIKPRSQVEIEVRDNEIVIRPLKSVRDVRGIFRGSTPGNVDWETVRRETEEAIAQEVADAGKR